MKYLYTGFHTDASRPDWSDGCSARAGTVGPFLCPTCEKAIRHRQSIAGTEGRTKRRVKYTCPVPSALFGPPVAPW